MKRSENTGSVRNKQQILDSEDVQVKPPTIGEVNFRSSEGERDQSAVSDQANPGIINFFRNVGRLIKTNFGALLFFQLLIIYSLLILSLVRKLLISLIKQELGASVLVQDNFKQIFQHPLPSILFLIMLLVELFFLLIGLIGNYRIFGASMRGERITIRALIKECLGSYLRLFTPKRIFLLLVLLVTMLLSYITLYTSTTEHFRIPEFLEYWFYENSIRTWIFYGLRILVTLIWVWMLFVVTGVLLLHKSFKEARRESFQMIRAHRVRYLFFVIMIVFAVPLIKTGLYALIMWIAYLLKQNQQAALSAALYVANWRASIYIPIVTDVLQIAMIVAAYCGFFRLSICPVEKKQAKRRWFRRIISIVVILGLIEVYYVYHNPIVLFPDVSDRPDIFAHRAGGAFAPENSLEALAVTKESRLAKGVEIDVQLSKDGVVILNHDPNLKRVTGNPHKASQLNLTEIQALKTKDLSGLLAADPIPTLEEFMKQSGDLKLMIELKEERALTEKLLDRVLSIVKEYKADEKVMIASMNRDVLRLSKQKAPQIETVLITAILLGADFEQEYVDAFSIEAGGVSRDLVEDARAKNKQIYVWTVNSVRSVKSVLRSIPDGIVTDNVYSIDYAMEAMDDNIPFQDEIMAFFSK